ncbi:hypothetical protein [Streptomyces sp. NPDC057557]|uniref:hypothetical protein n=1 Tax=Streptomyces sp. NPDC057557 TaxID=3346167 RepID=UPI0036A125D9
MTDEEYGTLRASAALWAGVSVLINDRRGRVLIQRYLSPNWSTSGFPALLRAATPNLSWQKAAVNSHLLITQQTASATDPVCADYVYRRFDAAGLTLRAVRADRILDEARATEDPVHLVRIFGISITTAMKYIHTAHPHRGGPIPP